MIAGSTGEAATLDAAERVALSKVVRDAVPEGIPVIVGTGRAVGSPGRRLTADVVAGGADGVIVLSPPGVGDPVAYYAETVRAADGAVPVLAYHFPAMSAPGIEVDTLRRLTDVGVAGLKDSSGDPSRLLRTLDAFTGWLYVGSPWLLSAAGPLGATGAILAVANVEPELSIAAFAGDVDTHAALTAVNSQRFPARRPSRPCSPSAAPARHAPASADPSACCGDVRQQVLDTTNASDQDGVSLYRRSPQRSQWVTASAGLRGATPKLPRRPATTALVVARPTPCVPPRRPQADVAADRDDHEAEHDRLDQAHPDVLEEQPGDDVVPVDAARHLQLELRDDRAAEDADGVGDDRQHRQHHRAGDHARHHQLADGIGAERPQRRDLIGHHHRPQLGGDAGTDAAGHHQRRQHRAQLLDHRRADEPADHRARAELIERHAGLQRQHHAGERRRSAARR